MSFAIGKVATSISNSVGKGAAAAFQAGAHSVVGGTMAELQGGSFQSGAFAGGISFIVGGLVGKISKNWGKVGRAIAGISSGAISGGIGSEIAGGNFWDGFRQGAITAGLNHSAHGFLQQQNSKGTKVVFDGKTIKVIDKNGNVLWEGVSTSGTGKHMYNPDSQHIENLGPIPEGSYSFSGGEWNAQSPLRQLYNIIRGNGDWGDYNVRLKPVSYDGPRHSFYLHGGSYPGSAGCIDALSGISNVRDLTFNLSNVKVVVRYGN